MFVSILCIFGIEVFETSRRKSVTKRDKRESRGEERRGEKEHERGRRRKKSSVAEMSQKRKGDDGVRTASELGSQNSCVRPWQSMKREGWHAPGMLNIGVTAQMIDLDPVIDIRR